MAQVFYGIQVRNLGWPVYIWNLTAHKPLPHRPCFMAWSIVILIHKIIIIELFFYQREYVAGQNVLAFLCV
jgi:hypothetical protein